MPSLQRQQAHPPEVRGASLRNVPSCPEGREAEEGPTTHHAMTTERDTTRRISAIVVTLTPEEFRHFKAGTLPDGSAARKAMERVMRYKQQLERDGIGAPLEIRVEECPQIKATP
jgi:hypothetical protein